MFIRENQRDTLVIRQFLPICIGVKLCTDFLSFWYLFSPLSNKLEEEGKEKYDMKVHRMILCWGIVSRLLVTATRHSLECTMYDLCNIHCNASWQDIMLTIGCCDSLPWLKLSWEFCKMKIWFDQFLFFRITRKIYFQQLMVSIQTECVPPGEKTFKSTEKLTESLRRDLITTMNTIIWATASQHNEDFKIHQYIFNSREIHGPPQSSQATTHQNNVLWGALSTNVC